MRQAVLRAPREIELRIIPETPPGPGEVLVRVRAALTCGTDLKTFRRGHPRLQFGPFGHEGAGDVAAIGPGVTGFEVGQPVIFTPTAPCGACRSCRRGHENLCATLFDETALGAYGDLVRVPARIVRRHLLPRPANLSYIEAAFTEPLACVVHAWRRLDFPEGVRVAVVGLGAIGLLHVDMAARRRCEVIAVGRRPAALALAARMGATHTASVAGADAGEALRALDGDGADIVIECTGSIDVWRAAPHWTAPGGRVLLFGGLLAGSEPAFDATRLHYAEVDLVSAFHYETRDVLDAVRLLASGEVRPAPVITAVRSLDEIRQVFDDLDRGLGIKYAVLPEGSSWR